MPSSSTSIRVTRKIYLFMKRVTRWPASATPHTNSPTAHCVALLLVPPLRSLPLALLHTHTSKSSQPPAQVSSPVTQIFSIPTHDLGCEAGGGNGAEWTFVPDIFLQVLQTEFSRLSQSLPNAKAALLQGWTVQTNERTSTGCTSYSACNSDALIWTSLQESASGQGGGDCVTVSPLGEVRATA